MTECFSFILLVLEYMCFTMICAFNLITLATARLVGMVIKLQGFTDLYNSSFEILTLSFEM